MAATQAFVLASVTRNGGDPPAVPSLVLPRPNGRPDGSPRAFPFVPRPERHRNIFRVPGIMENGAGSLTLMRDEHVNDALSMLMSVCKPLPNEITGIFRTRRRVMLYGYVYVVRIIGYIRSS